MDKYSRSVINEKENKFVASHESKKLSSKDLDRNKSKSSSSSSSSKHHSTSSKHLHSENDQKSNKKSERLEKDHKNRSDNKSSDKHHSSSKASSKRSRDEVELKDNEPKSKKIKRDEKSDKSSSSRTSSSKSSSSSSKSSSSLHKTDKHKSSSSSSSRPSKSKPAQIQIKTPDLLTQKPKLDLSPDLLNDLNVSAFEFLPPPPKSSNNQPQPKNGPTESELLTKSISSIKSRTRIFSGNTMGGSAIPKLKDMCLRVLTLNLDFVGCIGDIPFDILRPALEKAKPEQLTKIEYYNPYLLEDSDVLWKAICQRKWRNRQPAEMESWREMYERCNREDEEKLNRITKNIRQSQQQSSNCVQKTKIAFVDTVVKPSRGIVRKPVETFSSTKKPVMSLTARIEALKSSKPNFVVPKDVQSRIAASFRDAQPVVKRGTVQRTTSTKPAPMMAKLLSRFRR